jgi:hypothetical protein
MTDQPPDPENPDNIHIAAHPLPHGVVILECTRCGILGLYPVGTASHQALNHLAEEHGVPIP